METARKQVETVSSYAEVRRNWSNEQSS
jgi:hypothetical protein